MKVLLSAYACEPLAGSEPGKGWLFATALARQGCDVTVLTCGSHHRDVIGRHCAAHPPPGKLRFAFHDVPRWPGPGYKDARHIRQHYMAWQMTARGRVRRMLRDDSFDVIHHLTWTVLRWPSFLGGLGPRFVFGPVGGGAVAPPALRPSFPPGGVRRERLRDLINAVSRFDPMVRSCLRKADAILVTDPATRALVPARHHPRTHVVADILAPPPMPFVTRIGGDPTLLFVGRLEYWKGAHLAVMTLAALRAQNPGARLTIAGSGPEDQALRHQVRQLGLEGAVDFAGQVPGDRMAALYAAHDLFLFPSLHDSGPHVIGEALAAALPVICLDLGGPGIAVDHSCGAVVPCGDLDADRLSARLAATCARLLDDPRALAQLRVGAQARARDFDADHRARQTIARFYAPDERECRCCA